MLKERTLSLVVGTEGMATDSSVMPSPISTGTAQRNPTPCPAHLHPATLGLRGGDGLGDETEHGGVEGIGAVGHFPVGAIDGRRVLGEIVGPDGKESQGGRLGAQGLGFDLRGISPVNSGLSNRRGCAPMTLPPEIVHRGAVGGPSAVPYERLDPGRFPNFSVGMPHPAGSDIEEVGGAKIDGPMAIPGEGPIPACAIMAVPRSANPGGVAVTLCSGTPPTQHHGR